MLGFLRKGLEKKKKQNIAIPKGPLRHSGVDVALQPKQV